MTCNYSNYKKPYYEIGLTLTTSNTGIGSLKNNQELIKQFDNHIEHSLKSTLQDFPYLLFYVYERHNNGSPHCHIVIYTPNGDEMKKKLRTKYNRKAVSYANFDYLGKRFTNNSNYDLGFISGVQEKKKLKHAYNNAWLEWANVNFNGGHKGFTHSKFLKFNNAPKRFYKKDCKIDDTLLSGFKIRVDYRNETPKIRLDNTIAGVRVEKRKTYGKKVCVPIFNMVVRYVEILFNKLGSKIETKEQLEDLSKNMLSTILRIYEYAIKMWQRNKNKTMNDDAYIAYLTKLSQQNLLLHYNYFDVEIDDITKTILDRIYNLSWAYLEASNDRNVLIRLKAGKSPPF